MADVLIDPPVDDVDEADVLPATVEMTADERAAAERLYHEWEQMLEEGRKAGLVETLPGDPTVVVGLLG